MLSRQRNSGIFIPGETSPKQEESHDEWIRAQRSIHHWTHFHRLTFAALACDSHSVLNNLMAVMSELPYQRLHLIGILPVMDDRVLTTWEPGNQSSEPGEQNEE